MDSEFILTQGAGQKLEFAINRNGGSAHDVEWLSAGDNFKSAMSLARGEAELVVKTRPAPKVEAPLDTIVCVDRSIRPAYPDWVKGVLHPELEVTGPSQFDLAALKQWLHPGQFNGRVIGDAVYEHLKDKKMLGGCLGLRDLEEIQKKGIAVFRQHFQGKAVFGWKSVVRGRGGFLRVPFLIGSGGLVLLGWFWLGFGWDSDDPALRFASRT